MQERPEWESKERVVLAWAKRGVGGCLALVDHALDIACVSAELLRLRPVLEPLEGKAGRPLTQVDVARLSLLAGLHDSGKACREFQTFILGRGCWAGHTEVLRNVLCQERGAGLRDRVHAALGCESRQHWFESREIELAYWGAVLAHHALLPREPQRRPLWDSWCRYGSYDPCAALRQMVRGVELAFPEATDKDGDRLPGADDFCGLFAKVVKFADQTGSVRSTFPWPANGAPLGEERIQWARERARKVIGAPGAVDSLVDALQDRCIINGRIVRLPRHRWYFEPRRRAVATSFETTAA